MINKLESSFMPFSLQTEAVISKDLFILIWNAIC